ncbi:unnamed protein product [Vitrella brassicaformis CCMP3155]|uniref:Uncharacterized protein n=1 Tax=Vitrella brassicaformis (strain CCMP3155) TaxID=1169540 RepID=A0A0G4EVV0_VITBC|nr:unnamed protein product [Vitrella brassicaformis CCMP3155]|eukprot:CEM02221.1 unnamed protein product [Vitrella brassicaformis CCMP3155]
MVSLTLQIFYWPWLSNENNFLDVSLLLALCVMCVSGSFFIPRTDKNEDVFAGTLMGTVVISFTLVLASIILPIVFSSSARLKKIEEMKLKKLAIDSKIVGYCLYNTPANLLEGDLDTVTALDRRKLRQTVDMLKLEAIDKPLYLRGLHKVLEKDAGGLVPDSLYEGEYDISMKRSGRLTRAHMVSQRTGLGPLSVMSSSESVDRKGKGGGDGADRGGRVRRPSVVQSISPTMHSPDQSPVRKPPPPQHQTSPGFGSMESYESDEGSVGNDDTGVQHPFGANPQPTIAQPTPQEAEQQQHIEIGPIDDGHGETRNNVEGDDGALSPAHRQPVTDL